MINAAWAHATIKNGKNQAGYHNSTHTVREMLVEKS